MIRTRTVYDDEGQFAYLREDEVGDVTLLDTHGAGSQLSTFDTAVSTLAQAYRGVAR